jgi:hypothetical protein
MNKHKHTARTSRRRGSTQQTGKGSYTINVMIDSQMLCLLLAPKKSHASSIRFSTFLKACYFYDAMIEKNMEITYHVIVGHFKKYGFAALLLDRTL